MSAAEAEHPFLPPIRPRLTVEELLAAKNTQPIRSLDDLKPWFVQALPDLLSNEPAIDTSGGAGFNDGRWERGPITRSVMQFRDVQSVEDYIERTCELITAEAANLRSTGSGNPFARGSDLRETRQNVMSDHDRNGGNHASVTGGMGNIDFSNSTIGAGVTLRIESNLGPVTAGGQGHRGDLHTVLDQLHQRLSGHPGGDELIDELQAQAAAEEDTPELRRSMLERVKVFVTPIGLAGSFASIAALFGL